ncbi:MAG: hypothetical protein KBS91_04930 [Firmicutes bacterium]|nr:hypothetical protein [Candidatus Caballimonas caccae]
MKIKRKEMLRLKQVLMADRNEKGDEFISLLNKDLTKLLSEYFVFENPISCDFEKEGDNIKVSINLNANRIKPFGTIPE